MHTTLMVANQFRLGSTVDWVPTGTLDWNCTEWMIFPEASLLGLMVALSLALLTPLMPDVFGLWSGFIL